MSRRQNKGATLALTVAVIFLFILVGIGFFVYQRYMGGNAELQHATDSGNLNVAARVLLRPSVGLVGNEITEFGRETDNTNQVNLLNFNRIAAKVALVQANADQQESLPPSGGQPDRRPTARQRARQLTNMVYGPNGIALRLRQALDTPANLNALFDGLAKSNSIRMANIAQNANSNVAEHGVAYFARPTGAAASTGFASNVFIRDNQIPGGASYQNTWKAQNTVSKDGRNFLVGYRAIQLQNLTGGNAITANNGARAYGVPMRPGEQPHLVGLDVFNGAVNVPAGLGTATIIPNAFKSGGTASITVGNLMARSAAVVGTLNAFTPAGVDDTAIIIDNSGNGNFQLGGNLPDNRPWEVLMNREVKLKRYTTIGPPSKTFIIAARQRPGDPDPFRELFDETVRKLDISNPSFPIYRAIDQRYYEPFIASKEPGQAAQQGVSGGEMGFTLRSSAVVQKYGDPGYPSQFEGRTSANYVRPAQGPLSAAVDCTNMNSLPTIDGAPNPNYNADCGTLLPQILASLSNGGSGGSTGNLNGLMAVEFFAAQVAASFGGGGGGFGCALVNAPQNCSPLKYYDRERAYRNIPFEPNQNQATIENLLRQSFRPNGNSDEGNNFNVVLEQVKQRLRQMNPDAPEGQVTSFLRTTQVPFGQRTFVIRSGNGFTLTSTQPSFLRTLNPDGNAMINSYRRNVVGSQVDNPFTMWECPPSGQAFSTDRSNWVPSSGADGLLGAIEYRNCAAGGGNWCCP